MSSYEERRLANIKANAAELENLFGPEEERLAARQAREEKAKDKREKQAKAGESRKYWQAQAGQVGGRNAGSKRKYAPGAREVTRRSTRARRTPQQADEQALEKARSFMSTFQQGDDQAGAATGGDGGSATVRPSLEALREELVKAFQAQDEDKDIADSEWRDKAVKLWGNKVKMACKPNETIDWRKYYISRKPVVPSQGIASPLDLLQEHYADSTWKLLIACCLMSRVSSAEVKTRCLQGFFSRWPTPSAALDAPPQDVLSVLKPLGLFDNRFRSVLEISSTFLLMPEFQIDLKEHKVYGVGEFAYDSYLIFTRGLGAKMVPKDKNLRAYCAWAKNQTKGASQE